MDSVPQGGRRVTVGVDTHGEIHVAAVVDELGRIVGTRSVAADRRGYAELVRFAERFGTVDRFGVEGTGAYGAGLARYLATHGHTVVEVDRPDRSTRRRLGKSDPVDAEAAARAALSGRATGAPKSRDGRVEMIRTLRVARRSAVRSRAQAMNQMKGLIITAPESVRARLRTLDDRRLLQTLTRLRVGGLRTPEDSVRFALRQLARRHAALTEEIETLDHELSRLVSEAAPDLLALRGVGPDVAGQLLVTVGDNPDRLRSEASFAHLCGVAPVPASSGKATRHRLNRGGDRQANQALWRIVMVRLSCDERTRAYVNKRTLEGMSKPEIIRCLKRYVAREVFRVLACQA